MNAKILLPLSLIGAAIGVAVAALWDDEKPPRAVESFEPKPEPKPEPKIEPPKSDTPG
jgi:hypothetical protein